MRNCCVINCGNSLYTIERWKQSLCDIHGVLHEAEGCDCQMPFTLLAFPTARNDAEARQRWIRLINRQLPSKGGKTVKLWEPAKHSRVCSQHFVDGQPTAANPDPTLHLGYEHMATTRKRRAEPKQRSQPKKICRTPVCTPGPSAHLDHCDYVYSCDCREGCMCLGCIGKQKTIRTLQHENQMLKEALEKRKSPSASVDRSMNTKLFIKTNARVQVYTGLPNKQAFFSLLNHLKPVAKKMAYWKGTKRATYMGSKIRRFQKSPKKMGPGRKVKMSDELLLVLMKLRMGVSNQLLSDIFGVSQCTISRIFNTWVKMMSGELKPLVYWPEKDIIEKGMPPQLSKEFPRLRCTLDCTEVFIDRPRHLELQAQTWSDYKKHNTVKLLVAIAPNGMISFLSKAWGGRASDKHITRESGFLGLIDPTDVILADRGFTIQEDLLLRGATLFIPPPSSGLEQQSRTDVMKTKKIANARIHVERAIGRLKWFKILKNTLPVSLIPLIDDIIIICAALCNLRLPLVS